jgi:hypothetical protein
VAFDPGEYLVAVGVDVVADHPGGAGEADVLQVA